MYLHIYSKKFKCKQTFIWFDKSFLGARCNENIRCNRFKGLLGHVLPIFTFLLFIYDNKIQYLTCDGNLPWYNRMDDCTPITHHQQKSSIWKHVCKFHHVFQGEGIFITQTGSWLSMLDNNLDYESSHCRIYHFICHTTFQQPVCLFFRANPLIFQWEYPRYYLKYW